ncbi:MAG: alpha/beta hydrolase [Gammaproteobacteria bacterium]|nr:alpha/beta hydrolase [Gammaproteobacteria bacterium]
MNKIIFLHGLLGSKNNFKFLEKDFFGYDTSSFDLIGFGGERKPDIRYDVNDFLIFLEHKLNLSEDSNDQFILIGHSLGALLAKELTIKYPNRVMKAFLISYPFLKKDEVLQSRNYFDIKYAQGAWWTRILCRSEILYQWLFYPFIFLFRYKHRQSYIDFFKHTYQSAYGTIKNTILEDRKENLHAISKKIILINGEHDHSVDLEYSKCFNNCIITGMGHNFFGYESKIADVIKSNM